MDNINIKLNNSTNIWDRLSEVLEAENLDEIANKLGLNPSTLRGRKARESIPYEQIVQKLDVYDLAYVLKNKKIDKSINLSDIITHSDFKETNLDELEQYLGELVQTIEEGPFSNMFKIRIVATLMRIADDDLKNYSKENTRVPIEES